MRCASCQKLAIVDSQSKPPVFPDFVKLEYCIYDSVRELDESAAKGCELCRIWRCHLIYGAGDLSPEELLQSGPVIIRKANKGGWILSGEIELSFEEQNIRQNDDYNYDQGIRALLLVPVFSLPGISPGL